MGNVRLIDPLLDPRWDAFVKSHPRGWLCHLSGWKNVLENSFKHMKGYYFVLLDDTRGGIRAGFPIFQVKSYLNGNRLVSIPFATLFDPLVSTTEEFEALFEAVLDLFVQTKSSYIEIRSLAASSFIQNDHVGKTDLFQHHFLCLDNKPEQLKKKFHRSCVRQRISRAVKSDLQIKVGSHESDLKSFYKLYLKTRRRVGRPSQPYRFFKQLWNIFQPSNQLTLLLAGKDRQLFGGLILFKFKHRVSAEFAASDDAFKHFSPNHFLFWESIKLAYEEGYKIYDFGRTSPSNTNLMKFKGRWGTKTIDLPQYYFPKNRAEKMAQNEESSKVRLMSKICKNSPDFIQKFIGSFCYRHLG